MYLYICTNKMHKIKSETDGDSWTWSSGQVLGAAPCNSKDKLLFIIIEVIVRYMYCQRLAVAGLKLRPLNMIG